MLIYGYDYIILITNYIIIASDHRAIFDKHDNLFNIQFHITVGKNRLYYIIFYYLVHTCTF